MYEVSKVKESPKVFISYVWGEERSGISNQDFARKLAACLQSDGVNVVLDQWDTVPGDQLPHFMERSVRDSDYVLVICSRKYKVKSDARTGGVGYEGDLMTAEVFTGSNRNKFIPIWQGDYTSKWEDIAPSWLLGSKYIRLLDEHSDENRINQDAGYITLLDTLFGRSVNKRKFAKSLTKNRKRLSKDENRALKKLKAAPLEQDVSIAFLEHHFDHWIKSMKTVSMQVVVIDVDDLTQINRKHGRSIGDAVIKKLGEIFRECVDNMTIWGRFGDDTFFFSIPGGSSQTKSMFSQEVLHRVSVFKWEKKICKDLWVTCSAGYATWDPFEHGLETVIRAATAMKTAKSSGKNKAESAPAFLSAPYKNWGGSNYGSQKKSPGYLTQFLVDHYSYGHLIESYDFDKDLE